MNISMISLKNSSGLGELFQASSFLLGANLCRCSSHDEQKDKQKEDSPFSAASTTHCLYYYFAFKAMNE